MTTQALLNIIPPLVAAGAVLYIANRAQKAWPQHRIKRKGRKIVFGPNMASATEAFVEIEEA